MSTLRRQIAAASQRLAEAGVPSADHDARALAAHALGLARTSDLLLLEALDEPQQRRYDDLVARRAARVPLQHLTGTAPFRHLALAVGDGVFIPRPETESVVQWAVDAVKTEGWSAPVVVDLCAGSGAIALSIAHELPFAAVHAVERDAEAFSWLQRNAALRVDAGDAATTLHLADAAGALSALDGQVDLVVSNPPYVPTGETHVCDPEVVEHDPHVALFAGDDGLDVIRRVEQTARRLLRPGGLVVVEHSDRQGRAAPDVLAAAGGWTEIADHRDLAGRDRFLTARRR
jgi:release factor glutamine methyltransferase